MPGMFVKGFAIDRQNADKVFTQAGLKEEKLWGAFQELIASAKSEGCDLVVGQKDPEDSKEEDYNCPFILVLASDDDEDKLKATSIQPSQAYQDQAKWLKPFLKSEMGVYRRY